MRQEPLNDRELLIVRGMIDEYERHRVLDQFMSGILGSVVKGILALSALAVLAASIQSLFMGH